MFPGETIVSKKSLGQDISHYSGFKIIKSLGTQTYYIGTMFLSCGDQKCEECSEYNIGRICEKGQEIDYGSRETDYITTREEAEKELEAFKTTGEFPNQRY